jgi:hypothetical protein
MRVFSKSSILTAVALVAGGILLWAPTQASAQFNIEGMIRGAMGHPYYGNGEYRSRSSSHHAKSHSKQDDDTTADKGEKSDKNKEKDATQVEAPSNNTSSHPSASASPVQDASRSVETDAPARPSGGSAPSSDQPAFAPSR